MKKVSWIVVIAGAVVGLAAVVLTHLGNPANMGFCIACFLRDITGAVGMHGAAKVQYVRPEIIGLVLGAFIMSVATKEFRAKAGSSPATRFVLGAFVMIGALAFLGCPLRMVLRIGGGDLNAVVGLVGLHPGHLHRHPVPQARLFPEAGLSRWEGRGRRAAHRDDRPADPGHRRAQPVQVQ